VCYFYIVPKKGGIIIATMFIASLGLWNLYYYPSLDQWASFVVGVFVVTANIAWIGLILYYQKSKKGGQD